MSKRRLFSHRYGEEASRVTSPMLLAIAAAILIFGIAARMIYHQNEKQQGLEMEADHQVNVGSGILNITYQGKRYAYNNRITTVLVAGLDNEGKLERLNRYTIAPRADSISLVVLDDMNKKMTVIALSRDTMTKIRRYTMNGRNRGLFTDHLGYAYTYGDGWDVSCRNLCEAVSELLYGVPISEYVVMNRSSLPMLASTLGPVTVTVPNDDLSDSEWGWTAGKTAVIDSANIEAYLRYRDTLADLSNVGRMARQQTYINGAMETILKLLRTEASSVWGLLEETERYVHTNISHGRYLDLLSTLKNIGYDAADYYIPEGRQVSGADYDEFYPDEEKLLASVIAIFFLEK